MNIKSLIILATVLVTTNIYAVTDAKFVERKLKEQETITSLKHKLDIIRLKGDIAKTELDCKKNDGCGGLSEEYIARQQRINNANNNQNPQLQPQAQLQSQSQSQGGVVGPKVVLSEEEKKEKMIESMLDSLKLVAIVNNKVSFSLNDQQRQYLVGDKIMDGVVIKKVGSESALVSYGDNKEKTFYLNF